MKGVNICNIPLLLSPISILNIRQKLFVSDKDNFFQPKIDQTIWDLSNKVSLLIHQNERLLILHVSLLLQKKISKTTKDND